MFILDTSILNNIVENERKLFQERKAYRENYVKCLCKEEQFLLSLIQERKNDEQRCKNMKKDIMKTKAEMKTISTSIDNLEKENQQLKAKVKSIDTVIQNKIISEEDVNPKYKNLTRRTKALDKTYDNSDVLKTTHKTVIHKLNLYKEYLGCNVMFEEPNIYIFTFLMEGQGEGCIKFQYDSEWTVVDYKPENLLTDEDIKQFHKLQDTQKLLANLMIR
ncbi:uncharacterized protein LOC135842818 [Planococcus citri]|uniref:uncharacterized protein LOC135842818 n=1 Tax=Planococcus citri TaxID=170843 RepID=UPI0031F74F64